MKNKLFLLGMTALLCAIGVVVVSCDDGNGGGNLPVKTIKWETDGNGYVQFYTNDTNNCGFRFYTFADHVGDTYEAEVIKVSGNTTYGYGMLFCSDAVDTSYRILITVYGEYNIWKQVAGSWTELKGWTNCFAITQGYNKVNTLKVKKIGDSFSVDINNTAVTSFVDSDVTGDKIGAYVVVSDATNESFPNTPVDVRFKVLQ